MGAAAGMVAKEALPGMAAKFGGRMEGMGLKMPGPGADGKNPLESLLNNAHDDGKGPSIEQLGNCLKSVGDGVANAMDSGGSAPGPNDLMKAVAGAIKGLVSEVAQDAGKALSIGNPGEGGAPKKPSTLPNPLSTKLKPPTGT